MSSLYKCEVCFDWVIISQCSAEKQHLYPNIIQAVFIKGSTIKYFILNVPGSASVVELQTLDQRVMGSNPVRNMNPLALKYILLSLIDMYMHHVTDQLSSLGRVNY